MSFLSLDIFDYKTEQVKPFDNPDYIFELKLDGLRFIAYCDPFKIWLQTPP